MSLSKYTQTAKQFLETNCITSTSLLGLGVNGDVAIAPLQIDQSALTGESLPIDKKQGDIGYSSSIVKQGGHTIFLYFLKN